MNDRVIKIFDTTLRDGEQSPGCSMNLKEKIEVAQQLERLRVDVIEAGFAISSPGDFESVRAIADTVRSVTVASLARCTQKDIDTAWDAVKTAAKPRIHVFLATSPIHMEYKLKMTPRQVLDASAQMVKYAASKGCEIEFSAEDASRSDRDFLVKVFQGAIANGATVLNVPDTVGYAMPDEMSALIAYLMANIPDVKKAELSVHCHNDLGLGTANSLAAVKAGATQIECTINGIGERAGNSALEEIVMAIATKKEYFGAVTNVETKQLYRASKLISGITGVNCVPNKAIVGANAFAHEAGIHQHGMLANPLTYEIMTPELIGIPANKMVLGKHSGRHAFFDRVQSLGYTLDKEQLDIAFEKFKTLADKKKVVSDKDIEALVDMNRAQSDDAITLVSYDVHTSSSTGATVTIEIRDAHGVIKKETATGGGTVETAYIALNRLAGADVELTDYVIRSISEGEDAQGHVSVKMAYNGNEVTGRGLSVDVIESSIKAYINGLNKLLQA